MKSLGSASVTQPTQHMVTSKTSHSGGYLRDIPEPHTRMFPNPYTKRRVTVSVGTFDMVGGRHYHVTLQEQSNPIWDRRTRAEIWPEWSGEGGDRVQGWTDAWDDDEGLGRVRMAQFTSHVEAEWWIRRVSEIFPEETHELVERGTDEPHVPYRAATGMDTRYVYPRDGD